MRRSRCAIRASPVNVARSSSSSRTIQPLASRRHRRAYAAFAASAASRSRSMRRVFCLTHLSLVLGLCRDLLADTGCGLPCVLTITTVGLLVGQGESVASFTLRALWQLRSAYGRRLRRDVSSVKLPSPHRPSRTHITALHIACTAPSVMSVLWQCCRCTGWFRKPTGNSDQSTG